MSQQMNILDQVQQIFRKVFNMPQMIIEANTSSEHIREWDSMHHVLLITEMEQTFGIEFTIDDLLTIRTVGDFCALIEQKIVK